MTEICHCDNIAYIIATILIDVYRNLKKVVDRDKQKGHQLKILVDPLMAQANHKGVSFMCPFYYSTKKDDNKAWLQLTKEQLKEIARTWRLAKKILQNRRKRGEVIKTDED